MYTTNNIIKICRLGLTTAYESPVAAKEHETYIICRVPSQSKSIAKYLPYKESITLLFETICGTYWQQTTMTEDFQGWSCSCTTKLTAKLWYHYNPTHLKGCVEVLDRGTTKLIQIQWMLHHLLKHKNDIYQYFKYHDINLDCCPENMY